MVKTALAMRMTGIKTGVGLPHNIGHSNAWKNYSVNEVNEYKSRQYGSKGNKYRFSVSGNLLIYQPNKGQSFPIAKIRLSSFDDGVDRYYLEWLPSSKKLSKKERENAESCINKDVIVRKMGDTNTASNMYSVRDNSMLYGVVKAEMIERGESVIVKPPAKKEEKPEYYSGKVITITSRNKFDKKFKELVKTGIKFTKVDRYTLVID